MRSTFDTYRWHSVNLIPSVAVYPTVKGDSDPFAPTSTAIELTVLGRVFRAVLPIQLVSHGHVSGARGLAWSRRRHRWYTLGEGRQS